MNNAKITFNSDNSNIGYSKMRHCQIMSTIKNKFSNLKP